MSRKRSRHLLATGVTGRPVVYRGGVHQFNVPNIKRGAQYTVTGNPTRGLVLEPYRAFSRDEDEDDDVSSIG